MGEWRWHKGLVNNRTRERGMNRNITAERALQRCGGGWATVDRKSGFGTGTAREGDSE